jgi:hypothetical protein
MPSTFNGVPLPKITSIKTTTSPLGYTRNSFRVLSGPLPELEQHLKLNSPAILIIPEGEIEGTIVQYRADLHFGYEIMIESQKPG